MSKLDLQVTISVSADFSQVYFDEQFITEWVKSTVHSQLSSPNFGAMRIGDEIVTYNISSLANAKVKSIEVKRIEP